MNDIVEATSPIQAQPEDVTQPEPAPDISQSEAGEWSAPAAMLRLLLGAALEGSEQFTTRLRLWDRATSIPPQESASEETQADWRRYSTLGMMIDAQAYLRDIAGDLWDFADEATYEATCDAFVMATYALERWPLNMFWPWIEQLRADLEEARHDFEETKNHWTAVGRRQETLGRQVARQAVASLADEILDYVAKNPEVRGIVEQQSAGLADAAVSGVRERAMSADAQVERLVRGILRRPRNTRPLEPAIEAPTNPVHDHDG
jgi:hypothetical protein